MKTTILITGAAGNIGSALVKELIKNKNYFIIAIDNLSTGYIKNLPTNSIDNFRFICCDVNDYRDIAPIMSMYNFDYVFHYAAVVGVQRTLKHPVNVLRDFEGFKNIYNLSKNTGVKRIFFSSSSEVYGEPFEFPQHEMSTPLNSRLPYAVMKNLGEAFLRAYHQEFNIDYTIFRFFNTYSPNQTADFVVPRFIKAAIHNENLTIYGNGLQTRTFCYIDDNIETSIKIMENNLCINDTINVGNDKEYSILELANTIIRLTDSQSKIVHLLPLKEGDMTRRCPDISKMKTILNRNLISLEDGLQKIIKHHYQQTQNPVLIK
jgi:UDP-glucuronate decarboxylase